MRLLGLLFLLVLATACGGKNSNTNIKVTTSALFAGSVALQGISEGGLMLWGVNDKGNRFGQTLEDADTINLDLPNGTWTFYAVAWDNATNDPLLASTGMKCAESVPTQLAGTEVQVALAVSAATCANDIFRGYASSANSGTINAQLCENLTGVTAYNHVCSDDRITAGANWKSDKVPMMSVKVTLPNYLNNTDVPGGISRCMVMPSNPDGSWTNVTSMRLPIGDVSNPAKSPFRLRLEFFPGNNACDNTGTVRGSITRILPNGLLSPISPIKTFHNSGQHYTFLSLSDGEICNGRSGTYADGAGARFFAGGDGSTGHPHLICSVGQLYDIHELTSFSDSYKLLVDINLNPYSKDFNANFATTLPSDSDCWEFGQNWQPIGLRLSASPGCSPTVYSHTGSFDGNNHIITGMRQRFEGGDYIGFVGKWESTTGYIRDLVLRDPEVSGRSRVGALVGGRQGGGARGLIDNINIERARVDARVSGSNSYVGGLIGSAFEINISNVTVSGTVEGDGQYIGGVFGYVDNPEILRYIFSRTHVKHRWMSSTAKVGGVGGYLTGTNLAAGGLKVISHEGSVIAGGSEVGGLFGHLGSLNGPLNHYYAMSAISTLNQASSNRVGGIVGFMEHAGSMNTGYFGGQINDACASSCDRGYIYGYDNDAANPTIGAAYNISDDAFTRAGTGDNVDSAAITVTARPNDNTSTSLTSNTWTSGVFTDSPNPWVHVNGDHPRFLAEKHPCSADPVNGVSNRDSLTTQDASRGSSTNPIVICRRDQFTSIGSIADTNTIVIPTAVNLAGMTFPGPTVDADVTIDGKNQGVLFGISRSTSTGNSHWGVFGTIDGKVRNLAVRAIDLEITSNTGVNTLSTLARYNYGEIDNVDIGGVNLSSSTTQVVLAGVVNTNGGTIKNTMFDGRLTGSSYISGFAYINNANKTISDSRAYGNIDVPANGNYFCGFACENNGTLARNEVSSNLNSSSVLSFVSQFVGDNNGTVTDVHISNMANWEFKFGTDISQLSFANNGLPANGSITRALVEGTFLNTNITASTIPGSVEDQAPAVVTVNSAPHQAVFAVPAGRKILTSSGTACTSTSFSMPSSSISGTSFNQSSNYFVSSMLTNFKIVWLRVESNGKTGFLRVTDASNNNSNVSLTLEGICTTNLGFAGTVNYTLIQDYDSALASAEGDILTSPYNGFASNENYIVDTNFIGPWRSTVSGADVSNFVFADTSTGGPQAHFDWIFGVYEAYLSGTTVPPAPIWEMGDDEMDLFNLNK